MTYSAPVESAVIDGELVVWLACGHVRPGRYRKRDDRESRLVVRGRLKARMFCRECYLGSTVPEVGHTGVTASGKEPK